MFVFPLNNSEISRSRCPNKIFEYLKYRKAIVTNLVGEVANILEEDAHYFQENSLDDFVDKIIEAKNNPLIPSLARIELHSWKKEQILM